jgi:hypothetical protein
LQQTLNHGIVKGHVPYPLTDGIMKKRMLSSLVIAALVVSVSLNIASYANYMERKGEFVGGAYNNLCNVVVCLDSLLYRDDWSRAEWASALSSSQLEDACNLADWAISSSSFAPSMGLAGFAKSARWRILYGEENGYTQDEIVDFSKSWRERILALLQQLSKNGELSLMGTNGELELFLLPANGESPFTEYGLIQQTPNYFMSARDINNAFSVYFEEQEKALRSLEQGDGG